LPVSRCPVTDVIGGLPVFLDQAGLAEFSVPGLLEQIVQGAGVSALGAFLRKFETGIGVEGQALAAVCQEQSGQTVQEPGVPFPVRKEVRSEFQLITFLHLGQALVFVTEGGLGELSPWLSRQGDGRDAQVELQDPAVRHGACGLQVIPVGVERESAVETQDCQRLTIRPLGMQVELQQVTGRRFVVQ
jgi:hypothetical protein